MRLFITLIVLLALLPVQNVIYGRGTDYEQGSGKDIPGKIASYFRPPPEFAGDFGKFKSPLKFYDAQLKM